MTRLHVEAQGTAKAEPGAVWDLLIDATSYCQWGPWRDSGYRSPGEDGAGGVGAIRWFRYGRTTLTVEKVLEVEEGRRVVYTVLEGLPVRNYRAVVTLSPTEGGTHIHWAADWDRSVGGRIVHRKLRTLYPEIVADLIAAAETKILQ